MARTEKTAGDVAATGVAAGAVPARELPTPRLGEMVTVRVAPGLALVNVETGQDFVPDTDTLQTVTVTTLRRLADGDLVRVA